jgi:putative tricarboxylic transport membrane protein
MLFASQSKHSQADRVSGLIAVLLGSVALYEAYRKYPMRLSTFVGDYILLTVVGVLFVLFGLVLVFFKKTPTQPAPTTHRRPILLTIALLFLYSILLPILGYLLSTFLVAMGLFKVIGTYKWHISLLCALLLTAALYALFILALGMSFPTGLAGL